MGQDWPGGPVIASSLTEEIETTLPMIPPRLSTRVLKSDGIRAGANIR